MSGTCSGGECLWQMWLELTEAGEVEHFGELDRWLAVERIMTVGMPIELDKDHPLLNLDRSISERANGYMEPES